MSFRLLLGLITSLIVAAPTSAQVPVTVSEKYSAIDAVGDQTISNKPIAIPLMDTPYHDRYMLTFKADHPVVVKYIDTVEIDRGGDFSSRASFNQVAGSMTNQLFPAAASTKNGVLAITSASGVPTRVVYQVVRFGMRPAKVREPIKQIVELPIRSLEQVYVFPKFSVQVKPCGTVNAWSNPDIVICSELVNELGAHPAALWAVEAHEMAHTLLRLWGLPGWDNEDVADEFAVVILGDTGGSVQEMTAWLESRNSVAEAMQQLTQGDRHSISIQRARNMQADLKRLPELRERWSRMLAPYTIAAQRAQ
ncbi:DUF4344 domain-containing metallopeptidase [Paraburkholderia dipogonis]|nr:DUF4344 domain-containing metallopeptidase [Paraburkholderia dipogonis]